MEPVTYTLEDILQRHFGCNKPFLAHPTAHNDEGDLDSMTVAGIKAYEKLIDLIEELGVLLDAREVANHWVEDLDNIVDGREG